MAPRTNLNVNNYAESEKTVKFIITY